LTITYRGSEGKGLALPFTPFFSFSFLASLETCK
jgi:hypothetical protein